MSGSDASSSSSNSPHLSALPKHKERLKKRRLTLQVRLAVLTGLLLAVLSLALVLFINAAANVTAPTTEDVGLPWDTGHSGSGEGSGTGLQPLQTPTAADRSGGGEGAAQPGRLETTPTPMSLPSNSSQVVSASDTVRIRQEVLGRLQVISFVGLGLVVLVGSLGAYWVARQGLRPLREMSSAALQISTKTLDTRFGVQTPADEIKELADAIDIMLDRLERAFDQQSHFVADAAHELRTPLTTLRTNLEVVHEDPDSTLEDYREMASVLERALSRLERLVSDLLLIAMGEESSTREEVRLKSLLQSVIRDLKSTADTQQVRLRLLSERDAVVRGDGALLARAFSNLIENGIQYNREGGEVTVTISQGQDEREVWVSVSDTGFGIPRENHERIFDRFFRTDTSRSRHKGGAGLGLYIANHIVKIHGGRILIESSSTAGSTFTVRLPVRETSV